jgi:hypothetical protein
MNSMRSEHDQMGDVHLISMRPAISSAGVNFGFRACRTHSD